MNIAAQVTLLKAFRGMMTPEEYEFEVMGIMMDTAHRKLTDEEQELVYSL